MSDGGELLPHGEGELPHAGDVRFWPAANPPARGEGIACVCGECGQAWEIHTSMAGFKLRCDCQAWIAVPGLVVVPEQISAPSALSQVVNQNATLPAAYRDPAEPVTREVKTSEAVVPGALRFATVRTRQRWSDRAVLELAAIMAAFLGPQLIILFTLEGREQVLMEPVAALASSILVVALCWAASSYSFSGLRAAAARFYGEMLGVTVVTTGLAVLWVNFLIRNLPMLEDTPLVTEELGLGWALLLIGVFPAIFEELAFRGMVQGRLSAILGHKEGILATGVAFALAHGISLGLPFHFFLGWYLCSLRDRSGSLFPGMVLHFLYNATLVLVFR